MSKSRWLPTWLCALMLNWVALAIPLCVRSNVKLDLPFCSIVKHTLKLNSTHRYVVGLDCKLHLASRSLVGTNIRLDLTYCCLVKSNAALVLTQRSLVGSNVEWIGHPIPYVVSRYNGATEHASGQFRVHLQPATTVPGSPCAYLLGHVPPNHAQPDGSRWQ
jgi:hypothetical protein